MDKVFKNLGWLLLEHKFRYYILQKPIISDYEFDKIETSYRSLAKKLGLPPTASDMVGFDMTRPSAQRAAMKVLGAKWDRKYRLSSDGGLYKVSKGGKLKRC